MPRQCPKCEQIFYSDSEYQEHQIEEILKSIQAQNGQLFSNIDWRLGFLAVLIIKSQGSVSFDEALQLYAIWHDKFNAYLKEKAKRENPAI